jgi:ATP-dependent Clp protease ATP-binding subunit ClpA
MFERFTGRAREAVVLAQDEARHLRHNYIGTEHILLGLLREEEGLAARVLESLDITLEEVRSQVTRVVGEGDEVATGQIPFTPRAKKVLELSLKEALALNHNYIGTEHILLGVVRENQGVAARILSDLDADSDKIRGAVLAILGSASPSDLGPSELDELELGLRGKERATPLWDFERSAGLRERERQIAWQRKQSLAKHPWGLLLAGPLLALALGLLLGWLIWG